jgi:hypothetical protein
MAYTLKKGNDRILRLTYTDDVRVSQERFLEDFMPFLEASTREQPLLMLTDACRAAKFSAQERALFAELGRDLRLGKNAVLGVGRYARLMANFINKAAGRDNIRFFDSEQEALVWLNTERQSE